jgi:hypothetical protein
MDLPRKLLSTLISRRLGLSARDDTLRLHMKVGLSDLSRLSQDPLTPAERVRFERAGANLHAALTGEELREMFAIPRNHEIGPKLAVVLLLAAAGRPRTRRPRGQARRTPRGRTPTGVPSSVPASRGTSKKKR